ncbi:TatD family hydrolase [Pseudidiomarina woesei]|uniref:Tat protein secretion system quality control protein TatD (DNase activity) n=1 Tax=Pseudidiomarina woesei TaxID=1381080 RepID=A0A0K6HC59_9GAMM|nr:TatD family hydrolase [Pseudidiomarina woesei]CUA88356.1 Tat protein secretion system quality control protein TatD (DNase activity) [Pseudidiomarina woesei]
MKLFDSHCHIDFATFDADRKAVIENAYKRNVRALFVPGVTRSQSQQTAWLGDCDRVEVIHGFGLHPYFIAQHSDDDLQWLESQLQQDVHALVGEIGLDATCADYDRQYKFFCQQVELAADYHRPVVLHHRRTQPELLRVIKSMRTKLPDMPGVIHAFSGSVEQANEWIALGFMLGVGGTITYDRAKKTRAAIAQASVQHLVLETDAPDMPVVGFQGQRNEPGQLDKILNQLAQIRTESITELALQTWQNSCRLFYRS